jgi:hypothetical protein
MLASLQADDRGTSNVRILVTASGGAEIQRGRVVAAFVVG